MCVGLEGKAHGASEAKVRNFNLCGVCVHEQVAWLQVSVHDAPLVAVLRPLQQLVDDRLDLVRGHRPVLVQEFLHV